jgi:hypothetical protein
MIRHLPLALRLLTVPGIVLCASCGSQQGQAPSGEKPDGKTAPRSQAVELQGQPFPVDEDRIEVDRPKGWRPESLPRQGVVYLCRASGQAAYPRIYLQADNYSGLERVTKANAEEFAEAIRAKLRLKNPDDKREVKPVTIGGIVWASYMGRGRTPNDRTLDLVTLVTVSTGRIYSLQLHADEGTLETYTPHLHAMAGGINFSPVKEEALPAFDSPAPGKTREPAKTQAGTP